MNLNRRDTGCGKWLGYACVAILLLATGVQVVHVCRFASPDAEGVFQFSLTSSSGAPCLICLMAQSATALAFFMVFFPALRRRMQVRPAQSAPRVFLPLFQLYVRPPPAY